jgi:pyrroloquinoline quinone biosynthesis protein D
MTVRTHPFADSGRPRLRPGVRLAYDEVREIPVLLYPEGVLFLNETAAAVLSGCDGTADLPTLVAGLAARYRDVSMHEVGELLLGLRARRLVEVPVVAPVEAEAEEAPGEMVPSG